MTGEEVEKIIEMAKLNKADSLYLGGKRLIQLPESIGYLSDLTALFLGNNQLNSLPKNLGRLSNLTYLNIENNQFAELSKNISNLSELSELDLDGNPLMDLSVLISVPKLERVCFFSVDLPRRYWTKLSDWNPKWLLDEENAEIRQVLIQQIGYDRICQELDAIDLDAWREYTLLKIDADIDEEPMVLLKMTCPSTGHIHILRVPPEMTSAEAAITWVNHGIHPDDGFQKKTQKTPEKELERARKYLEDFLERNTESTDKKQED